jgi:hypothetical protein
VWAQPVCTATNCAKATTNIVRFAKRAISVAHATLICLNNVMIDKIALVCTLEYEGTKGRSERKKYHKKEDQSA